MIVIKRSVDRQWVFVVKARNGKVVSTSETYKRKHNALTGIEALREAVKGIVKEEK